MSDSQCLYTVRIYCNRSSISDVRSLFASYKRHVDNIDVEKVVSDKYLFSNRGNVVLDNQDFIASWSTAFIDPSLESFEPFYNWITDLPSHFSITVRMECMGEVYEKGDPANLRVFSEEEVERFGEVYLRNFPAYRNEKLPNGCVVIWIQDSKLPVFEASHEDIMKFHEYLKRCEKKDE